MFRQSYSSKRTGKAPIGSSDKENDTASSFNTIDSCAPQKRVRELKRKRVGGGGGAGGARKKKEGKWGMGDMGCVNHQPTKKRRRRSAGVVSMRNGVGGRRGSVGASTNTTYALPLPLHDGDDGDNGEDLQDEQLQDLYSLLPSSPPLSSGTHLSHYRILRTLGHGNFSTTYLAETTTTEPEPPDNPRLVAIKRLKRPLRLIGENEYSLLEYLHSGEPPRHVISPIDSFLSDAHFHLVLEPLDSARPVALPDCACGHSALACPGRHGAMAKILLQLLQGLLSLHSHGLIHADLTPANVLFLPGSNRVKIIDLGNTIRPEGRDAYLDDFEVQSACYRAPEILLGVGPLSRVMDVWSAGVIAVEMLMGGQVVGEGVEGRELLRGLVEGRDELVGRVVELVGSVREYSGGIYWRDVYDEISLEPAKRKLRPGRRKRYEGRRERTGILRKFLEVETADVGMVEFLMDMMEVGVSRRRTVMAMLRHPWLIRMLLGDWERVLTGEMEEVESILDQSEILSPEEQAGGVSLPSLSEWQGGEIHESLGTPSYRDIREQSTDVLEANMEPQSSPPVERPITPFQSSPPWIAPVIPPPASSPLWTIPATPSPPLSLTRAVYKTPYPSSPSPLPIYSTPNSAKDNIKVEVLSSPVAAVFQLDEQAYKGEDIDNSVPETSLLTGDDTTRIFVGENLLSSPPSSPFIGVERDYASVESRGPSPEATADVYGKEERTFEVSGIWDRDLAANMAMSDEGMGDEVMLC